MDLNREQAYPTPYANSTFLPMLLLTLATQKNAPRTAQTVRAEYDYIIVGAGSAGSTLAGRLSEKECVSILLLEAGGKPPLLNEVPILSRNFWFTDLDWQYRTVPQKHTGIGLINRQVVWPSGKAIGGSSILNSMFYVRGNHRDYDHWAEMGAEGWSYEDVFPYFQKMEDNRDLSYVSNGFHGVGGPLTVETNPYWPDIKTAIFEAAGRWGIPIVDPNGPTQTGMYEVQGTWRNGQRCSTAKAYLVPAENRQNLDILPNAFVRKVVIEKGRAIGVQFDYEEESYEVKARREVIMSAGTVNTAQILMLSGIGPRQHLEQLKIPVVADLPVGQNFHDHHNTMVFYHLNPDSPNTKDKLQDRDNIADYIHNRTGPLATSKFVSVISFWEGSTDPPGVDFPPLEIQFGETMGRDASRQLGLKPQFAKQMFGPIGDAPLLSCFVQGNHPRSRGTVRLKSTDPYEPPLIDPNYLADLEDIKALIDGMKICNAIALSEPLRDLGVFPLETRFPGCEDFDMHDERYMECYLRTLAMSLSHSVSTCKMGDPRDPTTVVDPLLRVKGIEGLRVVDASVMPVVTSGNTNVPTIMIAEKAADIIKQTIHRRDCRRFFRRHQDSSHDHSQQVFC